MTKILPHKDPPEEYIRLAEKLGAEYFVANMGQVPAVYRRYENGNEAAISIINEGREKYAVVVHIWKGLSPIAGNKELFGRDCTASVTAEELKKALDRAHIKYGKGKMR